MREANADRVRRLVDAFNERDFDTIRPLVDPGLVWYPEEDQPESGPFHGRESYLRYAEGWVETFDGYRVELAELTEVGDCVAAFGSVYGSGRASGVEVESEIAGVWRLRDGLVVEHRECRTRDEALELAARPSFALHD